MTAQSMTRGHRIGLAFLNITVLGFLAACSTVTDHIVGAPGERWQLNGLSEEARLQTGAAEDWELIVSNAEIPGGSDVELPVDSGIIRSDVGAIKALSDARFRMPESDGSMWVQHVDGNARYYVKQSLERPFDVVAPQFAVRTTGAVFEIDGDSDGSQIDVLNGSAQIWTSDRATTQQLRAGQSARVSSSRLATLEVSLRPGSSFTQVAFGNANDTSSGGSAPPADPSSAADNSGADEEGGNDSNNTSQNASNGGQNSNNTSQTSNNSGQSGSNARGPDREDRNVASSRGGNSKGGNKGKSGGKGGNKGKSGGKGNGKGKGKK